MCDTCLPNWEPPAPGEGETFDHEPDVVRPAVSIEHLNALAQGFGSHQPWNCPNMRGCCGECSAYYRRERFQQDSRDEERYDAERRAS